MKLAVWAVFLTWLELVASFHAPRIFVSRSHGLGSTTNGPRRRNNWEFAFGGQHQWHHRRTMKIQRSDSDSSKRQLNHSPNPPEAHSPRVTDEATVVVVESSSPKPPPQRENPSRAPLASAPAKAAVAATTPLSNSSSPLHASALPAPTVDASSASLPAATPLLLANSSSSPSSLVQHRPEDYAWAAMDVWHMQCALHHARSAAAEDEVPVSRSSVDRPPQRLRPSVGCVTCTPHTVACVCV